MEISVVIACYDQADPLDLVLESFLAQRFPHSRYEIIVVDDASPDHGARFVVASARRRYPDAYIQYVRRDRPDRGSYRASAVAKNIGLRLATSRYVFFNNAEICQAGESLEHIARTMAASDVPLCLRGRVLDVPRHRLDGLSPAALEALHDRTDRACERVASANHAGLAAVPRTLLIQVGGNDERFDYWGKEDIDLAARLERAGARYVYDEDLKSFHVHHPPNHVKEGDYQRMCALVAENHAVGLIEANVGVAWGSLAARGPDQLEASVLVEAPETAEALEQRLEPLVFGPGAEHIEVAVVGRASRRAELEAVIRDRFRGVPLFATADPPFAAVIGGIAERLAARRLAFVPAAAPGRPWADLAGGGEGLSPLLLPPPIPERSAKAGARETCAWVLDRGQAPLCLPPASDLGALRLPARSTLPWTSVPFDGDRSPPPQPSNIGQVVCIIPYWRCEDWVGQALASVLGQTQPCDTVILVADAGEPPPDHVLDTFPEVEVAVADQRVGPYALVQAVIDLTDHEWILFQDADDWSSADRLARLAHEVAGGEADLIGSQEIRVFAEDGAVMPVAYPIDVGAALATGPGHPLLHPTSLLSRRLAAAVGGFATGFAYGADTEFLYRAGFAGRIRNIAHACYYRRSRAGSLTTAPETGLDSPERLAALAEFKARARANAAAQAAGQPLDLAPLRRAAPVRLRHVAGPGRWRAR